MVLNENTKRYKKPDVKKTSPIFKKKAKFFPDNHFHVQQTNLLNYQCKMNIIPLILHA